MRKTISQDIKNENFLSKCWRKVTLDTLIAVLIPLLIVISALLLKVTLMFVMDSDPLWSIAVGEWINTNRAVPHVEMFSWTVVGEQWRSNSWMFCWLMYMADHHLGYLGIALIIFIPCLVTVYFIFFTCKRFDDSNLSTLIFLVGVIFFIIITIAPRAYIYTFAFIAIIMYILRFKRNSKWLYAIPLVMLLWVNVQTSIRFGMAILFIEALAGTFFFKDRRLWSVVILSFLATLINPYGFSLWEFSASSLLTPGTQYITEWKAPDFNNMTIFILYGFMFLTGLYGVFKLKDEFKNREYDRDKIMILFWFATAFIYSLTTIRAIQYVLLLWPACFTVFAAKLSSGSRFLKPVILVLVFFIFILSLTSSLPLLPLETDKNSNMPVGLVDYLQVNPVLRERTENIIPTRAVALLKEDEVLQDRLFNSYLFGGYLILENIDVFIDARESVFTRHNVTKDYFEAIKVEISPDKIIDNYALNTFLISSDEPLVFYLDAHPEWEIAYKDEVAVIYTRIEINSPNNQ